MVVYMQLGLLVHLYSTLLSKLSKTREKEGSTLMQVACPGCPTDTFRETLNPPNKVRLREMAMPKTAWLDLGGDGWGSASSKKKLEQKDPTSLSNPSTSIQDLTRSVG